MDVSVKYISTLAFGIQFVIFVYLYRSYRIRFFRYLVWGWGFFTASKGAKILEQAVPVELDLTVCTDIAAVAAVLAILAAAAAYRSDFVVRPRHLMLAAALAMAHALLGLVLSHERPVDTAVSVALGVVQVVAGLGFWAAPPTGLRYRGARLLGVSLVAWGLHRVGVPFVAPAPGTPEWMAMHGSFLVLYFLATFGTIIMVLDRARRETASLKEFNERLVDGLGEGLQLVDHDFRIRHANRWMQEQFGAVAGRRCYEVLTADGRRCRECPMERREEMGGPLRLEVTGPDARRFHLTCSPVRQPGGETVLLELVTDVTELERLHARLTEAERLAAAGELAASVAHEIRNPLAAIVNATVLLGSEDPLTPDERAATLGAVRLEARRLNRILSDFLVFARPRPPRLQVGDIGEVVGHVASLVRDDSARARDVELAVRVDPAVPRFAFDRDQLTQVVWNIALNGIEAMHGRGRLSVDVARVDGQVTLAISDTGRGIPPDELRRVFEPFYSSKTGGSGLGLTIADRIVAGHGGRIEVESLPEHGTRFTLRLPVRSAS